MAQPDPAARHVEVGVKVDPIGSRRQLRSQSTWPRSHSGADNKGWRFLRASAWTTGSQGSHSGMSGFVNAWPLTFLIYREGLSKFQPFRQPLKPTEKEWRDR